MHVNKSIFKSIKDNLPSNYIKLAAIEIHKLVDYNNKILQTSGYQMLRPLRVKQIRHSAVDCGMDGQ